MKLSYLWCVPMMAMIALSVFAAEPSLPYPADPETRKAIGAQEMTAAELKKKVDAGEPVLVIEVRDTSAYEKETIPGAIHIPFAHLQEALKEIPEDRTLVFT
jgi:3-mercaptopyruvate sulfurtransferase SseA